jgi:hypothetical protein
VDEEVQRLVREADDRAYEILQKNRGQLDLLVEALVQKEELLRDEIDELLRNGNVEVNGSPSDREILAPVDGSAEIKESFQPNCDNKPGP